MRMLVLNLYCSVYFVLTLGFVAYGMASDADGVSCGMDLRCIGWIPSALRVWSSSARALAYIMNLYLFELSPAPSTEFIRL